MKRIGIIGGGIAGLSAAFELEQARRAGAALEYLLLEQAPRLGGVMRTERVVDSLVEAGPDSWLTEKPWARQLCRELGLESELIGSNDKQRRTYILHGGRLHAIPDGLQFFIPTRLLPVMTTPLFSRATKLRIFRETRIKPRPGGEDESAAAFVERHFGREMVDRMAAPLLAGVYGGDADRLSARAVLPRFVELEQQYGSLTRAVLAARRQRARQAQEGSTSQVTTSTVPNRGLDTRGASAPALFTSLRGGMQQLVEAVTGHLDAACVMTAAPAERVTLGGGSWQVHIAGQPPLPVDAVILAVPAYAAAELLRDAAPSLAAELAAIPHSSSMTLALGYDEGLAASAGARIPPGFGFLVPRAEGRRLLACTFVHAKFPHRAPRGRLLLRLFMGGAHDPEALHLSDEQAITAARAELRDILNLPLDLEPRFARVYRWPRAMAQYEVGHLERVARIAALAGQLGGLHLAGNAYRGIGVSDCVRSGREAARQAADAR